MKNFMKNTGKIAIPVTLQSMLQSSFSIVDQLMIGHLGKNSIAAVGLCGNIMLIFSVVIGAIGTVAGIIISQFLGADDELESWRGFTVSGLFSILISSLFMFSSLFFSRGIIGVYTKDMATIAEGSVYLKIMAFSYIPMAISIIVATWLRCNDHAAIPLIASFIATCCNTGLNYILIFGKLGFTAYKVKGAGYATVLSQLINLVFIVCGFFYALRKDHKSMTLSLHLENVSYKEYMVMIMPILISEFLWSLGQNVNSAVYGHIGTEDLAAYTLTGPIQGLLIGALSGLSAAAGVIIGKQLGGKDYDGAYRDSKRLLQLGAALSVVLGAILIFCQNTMFRFMRLRIPLKLLRDFF